MAELFLLGPLFAGENEMDQLHKIIGILGTPPKEWSWGYNQARILGLNFRQTPKISLSRIIPNASKVAIDLLEKMLEYDHKKRPSAAQILAHPFFAEAPKTSLGLNKGYRFKSINSMANNSGIQNAFNAEIPRSPNNHQEYHNNYSPSPRTRSRSPQLYQRIDHQPVHTEMLAEDFSFDNPNIMEGGGGSEKEMSLQKNQNQNGRREASVDFNNDPNKEESFFLSKKKSSNKIKNEFDLDGYDNDYDYVKATGRINKGADFHDKKTADYVRRNTNTNISGTRSPINLKRVSGMDTLNDDFGSLIGEDDFYEVDKNKMQKSQVTLTNPIDMNPFTQTSNNISRVNAAGANKQSVPHFVREKEGSQLSRNSSVKRNQASGSQNIPPGTRSLLKSHTNNSTLLNINSSAHNNVASNQYSHGNNNHNINHNNRYSTHLNERGQEIHHNRAFEISEDELEDLWGFGGMNISKVDNNKNSNENQDDNDINFELSELKIDQNQIRVSKPAFRIEDENDSWSFDQPKNATNRGFLF